MSDTPPPIRQLGIVLWTDLPATCAQCGAAVDQADACRSPHPACAYCRSPLPCTPSPERGTSSGGGTRFVAELHLLTKAEGGRHTPVFQGYRPTFRFGSTPVKGTITFDVANVMVMPGDTIGCGVELVDVVALEPQTPFDILEGDHLVGRGLVHLLL